MIKNSILATILVAGVGFSGCDKEEYTIDQKADAIIKQVTMQDPAKQVPPEAKQQIIEKLKEQEALVSAARKEGLDKNESLKIISAITAEQALAASYLQKRASEYKPTDAELQKIYTAELDNNKAYHLRHILVKTEQEAKDVYAKLKAGESFDKLAKTKSMDTGSGEKGGDLGWSPLNAFVPEFKDAALALKPKEPSQPIKTQYGYHIMELLEAPKAPENVPPFEQAKEQIKELAKKKYIEELPKTLMAK